MTDIHEAHQVQPRTRIRSFHPHTRPSIARIRLPTLQHRLLRIRRATLSYRNSSHNGDIHDRHNASYNAIPDSRFVRLVCKLQSEAAVDDAYEDQDATEPKVRQGVEGACAGAFVDGVVDESEDGLDDEETNNNNADGGVAVTCVPLLLEIHQ